MPALQAFLQSRFRYFHLCLVDASQLMMRNNDGDDLERCMKLFVTNEGFFSVLGGAGNDEDFSKLTMKFFDVAKTYADKCVQALAESNRGCLRPCEIARAAGHQLKRPFAM